MRCGHCKANGPEVNVAHVRACSTFEAGIRSIGREAPAPAPAPALPSLAASPAEGIFAKDGVIYKVQQGTNTGNFYAKRWDGSEWVYEGRKPLHSLTEADRITAEAAAQFGHVTGSCVFCSRKLTDERSIAVGYGPVCAEHHGLPWGISVEEAVQIMRSNS